MIQKINTVFFDLDRTLWDFETNSKTALTEIYQELKLYDFTDSFEVFYATYREINKNYWERYTHGKVSKEVLRVGRFIDTLEALGVNNQDIGIKLGELYVERSPYQTHLFPNTKETLKKLLDNNYKLNIITNGFKEVQLIKLKNSGILHFFEDILCSEEVGKNKPHPDVFNTALKRAKVNSSNAMMVGDDFEADIIGAERCGIKAILFDPTNQFKNNTNIDKINALQQISDRIIGL